MEKFMVMESHGKAMENDKNMKSHGKVKKCTLIRVQNIVRDMVVSKIVQGWNSPEKFEKIQLRKIFLENC